MGRLEIEDALKRIENISNEYGEKVDNHKTDVDIKYNLYGNYSPDIEFNIPEKFPEEHIESLKKIFDEYNYNRRKIEAQYDMVLSPSLNGKKTIPKKTGFINDPKTVIKTVLGVMLITASIGSAYKLHTYRTEKEYTAKYESQLLNDLADFKTVIFDNAYLKDAEGNYIDDIIRDYKKLAELLYTYNGQKFDTNLYMMSQILDKEDLDKVMSYTEYKSMFDYLVLNGYKRYDDGCTYEEALAKFNKIQNGWYNILYGETFEEEKSL